MTEFASKKFLIPKTVIARRNQDGTAIVMKLDETSLFYKLDGVAAQVWGELGKVRAGGDLIAHFAKLYPAQAQEIETKTLALLNQLLTKGLIAEASQDSDPTFTTHTALNASPFCFGDVKDFNLEQIETEVLNESIYLDVFAGSDLRLKKDVAPIENALAKVIQLEGITYHWDSEKAPDSEQAGPALQAGLIAQQVAAVMPELVRQDAETGYLAVEYRKLNSYLVEAIKDLNRIVMAQDARIRQLEALVKPEAQA